MIQLRLCLAVAACLLCSTGLLTVTAEQLPPGLKLVQLIFRHGDRSAVNTVPAFGPEINQWPMVRSGIWRPETREKEREKE